MTNVRIHQEILLSRNCSEMLCEILCWHMYVVMWKETRRERLVEQSGWSESVLSIGPSRLRYDCVSTHSDTLAELEGVCRYR